MQPRGTASISTLVADDEQLALDELQYLLRDFPEIEVVGSASNGLKAVEMAEDLEPDLMFLDIHMPGLDGMSVIRRIRETTELPVAAYNVSGEYAMIKAAAAQGLIDERAAVLEALTGIRRAGADIVITYHAKDVATWLR